MPFKSKAQMKYMFAKMPKLAKEFASKTSNFKAMPNKVSKLNVPQIKLAAIKSAKVKKGKRGLYGSKFA